MFIPTFFNRYVYCRPCDLNSLESVRNCAKLVQEKEKKIDALINNAGVRFCPRSYTKDGIETHWSSNHLGHYLLTKLLVNQLQNGGKILYMLDYAYKKAESGIKFGDLNGNDSYDKYYAFYQSQLANLMILQGLAKQLSSKNINVNGVYPGIVRGTEIARHTGLGKSYVSKHVANPILSIAEITAQQAIATPLYLLTAEVNDKITGKLFYNLKEKEIEEDFAKDEAAIQKLLLVDDYWSGLKSKDDIINAVKVENKI